MVRRPLCSLCELVLWLNVAHEGLEPHLPQKEIRVEHSLGCSRPAAVGKESCGVRGVSQEMAGSPVSLGMALPITLALALPSC